MFTYILFLLIWIYLLSVFKRKKLDFYYFVFGAVGMFIFLLTGIFNKIINPLSSLITYLVGLIKNIVPTVQAFPIYKLIYLDADIPISLYVDFECSGILEIFAFVSLVSFFTGFNIVKKISLNIIGIIYIITANVLRILSIIFVINVFGSEYYYIAHTLVGRIIFYVLTIILYFIVFTKYQILNQKVGNFEYN